MSVLKTTLFLIFFLCSQSVLAQSSPIPAVTVRTVLSVPDAKLDYTVAKLAFDRIVDPSMDGATVTVGLDALAKQARAIAGKKRTRLMY